MKGVVNFLEKGVGKWSTFWRGSGRGWRSGPLFGEGGEGRGLGREAGPLFGEEGSTLGEAHVLFLFKVWEETERRGDGALFLEGGDGRRELFLGSGEEESPTVFWGEGRGSEHVLVRAGREERMSHVLVRGVKGRKSTFCEGEGWPTFFWEERGPRVFWGRSACDSAHMCALLQTRLNQRGCVGRVIKCTARLKTGRDTQLCGIISTPLSTTHRQNDM